MKQTRSPKNARQSATKVSQSEIREAMGLFVEYCIGNAQGGLGAQMPGIVDEVRAAFAPFNVFQPDYGYLTEAQRKILADVQEAHRYADLSRAAPGDPAPGGGYGYTAQYGVRS